MVTQKFKVRDDEFREQKKFSFCCHEKLETAFPSARRWGVCRGGGLFV